MTQLINHLEEIIENIEVFVLDQWGVLHNGITPYPHTIETLSYLRKKHKPIVVLSNSGKRTAPNLEKLASLGIVASSIDHLLSSGEVFWQQIKSNFTSDPTLKSIFSRGNKPAIDLKFFMICRTPKDAEVWAHGLSNEKLNLTLEYNNPSNCDAMILMGPPSKEFNLDEIFSIGLKKSIPMVCTNPDHQALVVDGLAHSSGYFANKYAQLGGKVIYYGKPYSQVFQAVRALYPDVESHKFLMVGDSLHHDILGGFEAGFKTLLIREGILKKEFSPSATPLPNSSTDQILLSTIEQLSTTNNTPVPDYSIKWLTP